MGDARTVKHLVRNPTERQRKAAANLAAGMTIKQSLLQAGYSEETAGSGFRGIPATVLALMPVESNLIELGRSVNVEEQESAVRGRLLWNVLKGQDSAVNSAYRLGMDRRVNMFTPESQLGVIVVTPPQELSPKPKTLEYSDSEDKE